MVAQCCKCNIIRNKFYIRLFLITISEPINKLEAASFSHTHVSPSFTISAAPLNASESVLLTSWDKQQMLWGPQVCFLTFRPAQLPPVLACACLPEGPVALAAVGCPCSALLGNDWCRSSPQQGTSESQLAHRASPPCTWGDVCCTLTPRGPSRVASHTDSLA